MELYKKGLRFFGLFIQDVQIGFVAVERADATLYYMEKLAVLPQARNRGYGTQLIRFVFDYVTRQGAGKLSIGTIHEDTGLKYWYKGLGFVHTGTKKFDHLPFTVCFMEADLALKKLPRTPKAVVIDAMGVIYRVGDDVRDLLCPFIAGKGGETNESHIERLYRSASLGNITTSEFWEAVGISPELEEEYLTKHRLTRGLIDFLEELRLRGIQAWCLSNDVYEW